jgi:hypothetical protein
VSGNARHGGTWADFHTWNLVLPPSRPSVEDLAVITKLAMSISRADPVAVMGSTPEFRDHLYRLGFIDVSVIDSNPSFHRSVSGLLTTPCLQNETYLDRQWQEHFTQCEDRYSLVLSDLTLGNVPYVDRRQLYAGIWRSIKVGGYFVDKVLTNEGRLNRDEDIASCYSMMPLNLATLNNFNCEAIFCGDKSVQGLLNAADIYAYLEERHESDPTVLAFVRACPTITPPAMQWYYGLPWTDVQGDYMTQMKLLARVPQPTTSAYHEHAYQFLFLKE